MRGIPEIAELADFAMLPLELVVNQAGNEHTFLDLKIKKSYLHNCLRLPKLQKMSKVSVEAQGKGTAAAHHNPD